MLKIYKLDKCCFSLTLVVSVCFRSKVIMVLFLIIFTLQMEIYIADPNKKV